MDGWMESAWGEGGILCERLKVINKRIGHRGRGKDQERGGGTKRGEGGRVRGGERRSDTGRQSENGK